MELPADPVVSSASEEGSTLCFLFGNAFRLARSEFSDLYGYVYANVWSKFVLREAYAAQVVYTDAGEIQATDEQLVQNGQCLLNVQLCVADNCGRVRCGVVPFKPNESVWLSRNDPYEDGHPRALKIDRVAGSVVYFKHKSRYPKDAEEGFWRLDLGINEVQVSEQLHCIKNFAQKVESPLYPIIVKSMMPSTATTLIHPPLHVPEVLLRLEPGCDRLNDQQRLAVKLSLEHHLLLIQGPPGTGKTTTATALMIVHARYVNRILVVLNLVDACEGRCVASVCWLFGSRTFADMSKTCV